MYIKSVYIDGFKSYGKRTEILGFDREFTAITGLNGTGKSNILDSICFVLGIMNLSQVRAASLQDLVFKSGQAGITKATVTLIFDNTDPEQCPLGYEKCREISVTRQIVVGGKNKYLINGKIVQNKKIADFFCSVQLNVNNPNFLIMQGRITKVINMKPKEILSMIEEAAGTSLYDSKREATNKLIERKDVRIREANQVLTEQLEPKLEKLRKERADYTEFQKICKDIDYLTRIHISYRYTKHKQGLDAHKANLEKISTDISKFRQTIEENKKECEIIDENCKELQDKIDTVCSGKLKEMEEELRKLVSKDSAANADFKSAETDVAHTEKNLRRIDKSIKDDERILESKETKLCNIQTNFDQLKQAETVDKLKYEAAEKRMDNVSLGLTTNEEGVTTSLQDELISTTGQLTDAETAVKVTEMELVHVRNKLRDQQNKTQKNDDAYIKDKECQMELEEKIKQLEAKLRQMNYEDGLYEKVEERKTQINMEIRNILNILNKLNAQNFNIDYKDPEPNFDRSKVHGMVGKLFNVKDPQYNIALQAVAGGHLFSHVVDNDITCKKILEKGDLTKRVTIIPMNTIKERSIDPKLIENAQKLVGEENIKTPINLIEHDKHYDSVMKFAFGHSVICKNLDVAEKITFNPKVSCRSVTLDGDILEPEGTLTGGAREKSDDLLPILADIKHNEELLKNLNIELQNVNRKLESIKVVAAAYDKIKADVEDAQLHLAGCLQRLSLTSFQEHEEEINSLKQSIIDLESTLVKSRESVKMNRAKIKDLKAKTQDADGYRKRELKQAKEEMEAAAKKAQISQQNVAKHESEYLTLKFEIEALRENMEKSKKGREILIEKISKMKSSVTDLQNNCKNSSSQLSEFRDHIDEQKKFIRLQNRELNTLEIKKEKLHKQNNDLNLDIKIKETELNKMTIEKEESLANITDLENRYSWILEDCEFFGQKNTRYDYSKENPIAAEEKLSRMREKKEKMEKHINVKAMMVLDKEEEIFQTTMRRINIVQNDKEKIKNIICKMDEKKREKLESSWKMVNENFGSIFGTLLQGAQARLHPITQDNHLVGLEIKVGFNGVWKESLNELSGGQRSLVALSLVLAMLKFSPAPLYILDEVDAALDMTHTQNIGNMLKEHFTNSQFIIVSLKDSMFNNANVLFRTKFEEGISVVTRTLNSKLAAQGSK
ncbi:structural maintenance of chromosomes protein 2-like [Teleopsis dalmanni]|uniref:structural maintenance of chromosomes protein 2-like n=1 Tax=Teleopsis dalmanni TaxID=139649 RepID=UPI0018CDC0EE|nr:structural maintenance of chromosomes protein 2-like [Teleopsis dalmanni]